MLFLIQLLLFIHYVLADIPPQEVNQYTNGNNIIVASLYAMGVCSCASLLCKHKNKLPITITRLGSEEECTHHYIKPNNDQSISTLKEDIDELKDIIDNLYIEEKAKNIIKVKKGEQENNIEPHMRFMFGQGEIKYKTNGRYYHGTDVNNMERWIKGDGAPHRFFERIDGKDPKWSIATKDHNQYCKNCSYDEENSKRRTVYKVYKCNGHDLIT